MVNLNWANPPFPVDVAPHHMPPQEYLNDLFRFLAVQDSSISDIVGLLVGLSLGAN